MVGRGARQGHPPPLPQGPTYQPFWAPSHIVGAALVLAPAGSALGSGSGCTPPVSASGPFSLREGGQLQGGPWEPVPAHLCHPPSPLSAPS